MAYTILENNKSSPTCCNSNYLESAFECAYCAELDDNNNVIFRKNSFEYANNNEYDGHSLENNNYPMNNFYLKNLIRNDSKRRNKLILKLIKSCLTPFMEIVRKIQMDLIQKIVERDLSLKEETELIFKYFSPGNVNALEDDILKYVISHFSK
jgi:hypothetical protein